MNLHATLQAVTGWLELGLADEALLELNELPAEAQKKRLVLELKLAAQMQNECWNRASDTARLLCLVTSEHGCRLITLSINDQNHGKGTKDKFEYKWMQKGQRM